MPADPDHARLLGRALAYPGEIPPDSFALGPNGPVSLDGAQARAMAREAGPIVLLAYGSNAAPEGLERKLGPRTRAVALRGELAGWDAVYSAHLAAYGAVPATLWPSTGTIMGCHLLFLTASELAALDATEPNYQRRPLYGAESALRFRAAATTVWAYHSRHGALRVGGKPLGVGPVPARGRRLAAEGQAGVLAGVRDRLDPGRSLAEFVARAVADVGVRAGWTATLRSDALRAFL